MLNSLVACGLFTKPATAQIVQQPYGRMQLPYSNHTVCLFTASAGNLFKLINYFLNRRTVKCNLITCTIAWWQYNVTSGHLVISPWFGVCIKVCGCESQRDRKCTAAMQQPYGSRAVALLPCSLFDFMTAVRFP